MPNEYGSEFQSPARFQQGAMPLVMLESKGPDCHDLAYASELSPRMADIMLLLSISGNPAFECSI